VKLLRAALPFGAALASASPASGAVPFACPPSYMSVPMTRPLGESGRLVALELQLDMARRARERLRREGADITRRRAFQRRERSMLKARYSPSAPATTNPKAKNGPSKPSQPGGW
jgi:hypothetical protein